MRSKLLIPGRIKGTTQGTNECSNALRGQTSSVVTHAVAEKHCILFLWRRGGFAGTETSDIQPDRLFNWFVQNNGQVLSMVPFCEKVDEMLRTINISNAEVNRFSSIEERASLSFRISGTCLITSRNMIGPVGES